MRENIIEVKHLKKSFDSKAKSISNIFRKDNMKVYAVDDVSFKLKKSEVLGIIGESGCGKSTTARLLLRLIDVDQGEMLYDGKDISRLNNKQLRFYRKKVSIIFQDPYEYLNPRQTIFDIIAEPLIINDMVSDNEEKTAMVIKILESMDLKPAVDFLERYTHELSGGQMQRIAIARALITEPELLIADEPTSMLDVSVRAGILNLLLELKNNFNLSMVFITHDITTAGYMCDRIAVMYKGRIVEIGKTEDIIYHPLHPYTKALLSVATNLKDFLSKSDKLIKDGEVDSYVKSKACGFIERCVYSDEDCNCDEGEIGLRKAGEDHYVACCHAL